MQKDMEVHEQLLFSP